MSIEGFKERMDYLYQRVAGCEKMDGVDRIYYPGEVEELTREKRLAGGIPFTESEISGLNKEAEAIGVPTLKHH